MDNRTPPPLRRIAPPARGRVLLLAAMVLFAVLAARPRAEATCCACTGGACGAGFCVNVQDVSECTPICAAANCMNTVSNATDSCVGGCFPAPALPTTTASVTATPTTTATISPTPSSTSSTETATATATATGTVTLTGTITLTPTLTLTPTVTATPIQCCECPATNSCGQPTGPSVCSAGCNLVVNSSCDSRAGGSNLCLTNTATPTVTLTRTASSTPTATNTLTATVTITSTPTITPTPVAPTSIDPYKCYRIKRGATQPRIPKRIVTLVDQFENKRTAVLKPFLICNPIQRLSGAVPTATPTGGATPTAGPTGTATPLTLIHPEAHLVCYKIRDENKPTDQPKFKAKKVVIRDQVEPEVLSVEQYEVLIPNLVCLPAAKTILP